MIFAELHRRFIASHLLPHHGSIPNDALVLLSVGCEASHERVEAAFRLLQEQVAVPLRLHQASMETDDLWPLLAQATLLICNEHRPHSRWVHRAMGADVPVVETELEPPQALAARLRAIVEEPARRRRLVLQQRAYLETRTPADLLLAFGEASPPESRIDTGGWRIEGPFDSSFSLAIVNRSLAMELERQGERVALGSVDAEGPRSPDPAFLQDEPGVEALWHRGITLSLPDVVTRNLWPPHVLDMRGLNRVMANYAWEESGFPPQDVAAFNATLNLITVTSHFVTKVLRDNGVHVPIAMVGNGIFQPPEQTEPRAPSPRPYRYLHISSCYPRKGVDVLLAAWAQGFTHEDGVELVIKTFPNAFNTVAQQIAQLRATYPDHAPIILIEEDISEDQIHQLYASADAVVCPARGEGFGLPMAEAFAHGKPVVTTGFSGQRDFCTPETAWLCDFRFAYSRSHLGMSVSVWAEPDIGYLVAAMQAVRTASPEEVMKRVGNGQSLLRSSYNWNEVTRKTRHAVDMLEHMERVILHKPKIGWLEPWDPQHPVSDYCSNTYECSYCTPFTSNEIPADLDAIFISDYKKTIADLADMAEPLEESGKTVFIFLLQIPDQDTALKQEYKRLSCATRIIVHSTHSLNILKDMGLVENVTLLPYGIPMPFMGDRTAVRRALGLEKRRVLVTSGSAHRRKGLRDMIEAFELLLKTHPDLHLLMLHEAPEDTSAELETCHLLISEKRLFAHVTMISKTLTEYERMSYLASADIAVFPTQAETYCVDRDVRPAISAGIACACTDLPVFDDVAPIIRTLPGFTANALADGLSAMLADDADLEMQTRRQSEWARQITRPIICRRISGMVRGLCFDKKNVEL